MLIPFKVDVPMERWPIANFVLIGVTVVFFGLELVMDAETIDSLLLGEGRPLGWFFHMFMHAGIFHLVGNMLFLWVFGNAVCAKVGNLRYALIYVGLGLIAGISHYVTSDAPMLGASGAVNGIVGMYLIMYSLNDISCLLLFLPVVKTFALSSFWMILYWFVFDIYGVVSGGGDVAYAAHLGGFLGGFAIAFSLLYKGWVEMTVNEKSLLDIWHIKTADRNELEASGRALSGMELHRQQTQQGQPKTNPASVSPEPPSQRPKSKSTPTLIKVICAACQTRLKVPAAMAGRKAACPKCKAAIQL